MEYTGLKIRLLQQGAVFTEKAKDHMCKNRFGHITFHDYATTGGVIVEINGLIFVNVPESYEDSPFCIDYLEQRFILTMDRDIVDVAIRILPVPQYALDNVRLGNGVPVRELVMTHAHRLRISPIHGCSYHCQFCTCNGQRYNEIPCEDLDQAVQIALQDPNISPDHVLISGGTPDAREETYLYLNKIYQYFPKKYPSFEFDVMLSPRGLRPGDNSVQGYNEFLNYLYYECGIQTLSVNLELFNQQLRKRYIPEKCKIGLENYFLFIHNAVDVFGKGKIRSSLVVGLEKMEDTLKGVEEICKLGCIPVLSAFVPDSGTDMASFPKPSVDFLIEVVSKASDIAAKYGTMLGPFCRPCTHNSLTKEKGSITI